MTKAQYKAITDFRKNWGYTIKELLEELEGIGAIEPSTKVMELDRYVSGTTYEFMYKWLEENLL